MQSFVMTLLTCSVTMSALALLYMAVSPLLERRYSEKGRYYAWLIIVIGLIIPFRPQFDNTIVKVDIPSETTTPIIQAGNVTTVVIPDVNTVSPPAMPSISLWQAAIAVWLLGMIAFLAYHIIKHYCFVKLAGRWSESITDVQTLTLFQSVKAEMGIFKKINLYMCSSVSSPMMIGFSNTRILLPKDDLAQDEFRFILKHELVHFKRKDLLYKYLVLAATAIHWFNPIIHLMAKAIATGCELSCDAEVVRNTDEDTRRHYSQTIIGVVKYQSKLKTALSTNFYGGKRGMKKRIFSIMDTGRKKTGATILCCMLAMTLGTGMAFAANTNQKDSTEPQDIMGQASSGAVTIYGDATEQTETNEQTEEDITHDYEIYVPFGLVRRNGEMFYNGEAVRLFDDWYSLGEEMQAGRSYFNNGGTVDVHAVRDFSQTVYNPDGSVNPGGRLVGVEACSQTEFDARDLSDYYTEPIPPVLDAVSEVISYDALWEGTPQTNVAEDSSQVGVVEATSDIVANLNSDYAKGRTIAEMFEDYASFGVKFDTKSINGGLGNIYFNGKLVKQFVDLQPDGGTFSCSSSDGGDITVRTVYDENGNLTGVE